MEFPQVQGFVTYEYSDYGVKIDYPQSWLLEEFAFDDRHLKTHPGHLPGLPFQFFRPTELDMKPQNKEIYVLGLYPPFDEGQEESMFSVSIHHLISKDKNIISSSDRPV